MVQAGVYEYFSFSVGDDRDESVFFNAVFSILWRSHVSILLESCWWSNHKPGYSSGEIAIAQNLRRYRAFTLGHVPHVRSHRVKAFCLKSSALSRFLPELFKGYE